MLEAQGSGSGASNSAFAEALRFARRRVAEMIQPQRRFAASAGKQKRRCTLHGIPSRTLSDEASSRLLEPAKAVLRKGRSFDGKIERHAALHDVQNKVISELQTEGFGTPAELDTATSDVTRRAIRDVTHDEDVRPDGRSLQELRTIKCQASVLPRVHGSSIFQRGDTQLLATTTLGSLNDAQKLTGLTGPATKRTMVSYSFPGFCVNEVRSTGNVSRREIGHGALAERGLQPIIPNESDLPFSIRLSTDVLSSNGSSSMGAVCAGSLALMDAGVPIPEHVAGVSVGLSMDHDVNGSLRRYVLPVDIQGVEDALGDMDFKVAGTRKGVTALQLDCKPAGIPLEILIEALDVAQSAREKIISFMDRAISQPHSSMSTNAPRFGSLQLPSNKLGAIIGPGGSTIREIESLYDTKVNVNDSNGTVSVFAPNKEAYDNTIAHMYNLTAERKNSNSKAVEVGETVPCRVEEIRNFGAIVQCVRSGERGLLHVSQIAHERVQNIQDFISPQDELEMECLERTDRGVRFSRKRLLPEPEKHQNDAESQEQKRRSRR
jgi:polyribonucleotide nucleotidyltransferase